MPGLGGSMWSYGGGAKSPLVGSTNNIKNGQLDLDL